MTLNLLQHATANPAIYAWGYFNGKFNYNATALGPLGISVIVHTKPGRRQSWDFRGKYGWSVGESMTHYRFQRVIPKLMRSMMISDTTGFRHHHITQLLFTPEDRVLHRLQQLTAALQGSPYSRSCDQIRALQSLKDTLTNWDVDTTPKELTAPRNDKKDMWDDRLLPRVQQPVPRVKKPVNIESPQAPRVLVPRPDMHAQPVAHRIRAQPKPPPPAAPPKVPHIVPPDVIKQPVAHRTRSRALTVQPSQAAHCKYPSDLLELWCTPSPPVLETLPVLDEESGKLLEHRQL